MRKVSAPITMVWSSASFSSSQAISSGPSLPWQAGQPSPVVPMPLTENRGGAGGFHVGLQAAYDRGADLVWLMDDDGLPEPDCLKMLLDHDGYDFWGPAVLAEQDPSRLCFPIRLPCRAKVVHRMDEVDHAARDGVIA